MTELERPAEPGRAIQKASKWHFHNVHDLVTDHLVFFSLIFPYRSNVWRKSYNGVRSIRNTWIENDTWPIESWCVYGLPTRTNNDTEGWHHRVNGKSKPNLNPVIGFGAPQRYLGRTFAPNLPQMYLGQVWGVFGAYF